jgi:hypothetical protein
MRWGFNMDKEGLDTITKVIQLALEKLWPKYEFEVQTALTGSNKRIDIKVTSQLTLDDYWLGSYESKPPQTPYPCFYIFIHPSKLTKDKISDTFFSIISSVLKQDVLLNLAE